MKRNVYKNEDYLNWVRMQPCIICGHQPTGIRPDGRGYLNAVHHVIGRNRDDMVVPACDAFCDPYGQNCHKDVIHKDMRYWRPILLLECRTYQLKYTEETGKEL